MAIKNFNFCLISFVVFLVVGPYIISATKLGPVKNVGSFKHCDFNSIYQLGDSISDTGNLVIESPYGGGFLFNKLPYGQTLGTPTGRCSNGLLMIDYFALSSGLPYLNPYKKVDASFSNGVNFAVAGATVLSSEALIAKGFPPNSVTNSALGVQLEWMSSYFNSTCHTKGACQNVLRNSLFMVGEVGGNDYNYALLGNKGIEDLNSLIPYVVQGIAEAVRKVISFGATKIIVPGNFPIGCHPIYLSLFQTNDSRAYDSNKCLKGLNDFAVAHNEILQGAIQQLRTEYPNALIVYGDYYNAFLSLLSNAKKFGLEETQKACCGSGGEYNFSVNKLCGMPGVTTACPNPNNHLSWDGIHMTQQAYKFMSKYLIKSILPQLQCF